MKNALGALLICLVSLLVPPEQRGRVPTRRRSAVRLRSRGPADRHVPLQVQADEADPNVQRSQAHHLLQIQHSKCQFFSD